MPSLLLRAGYLEGRGQSIIMEKNMEATTYHLGFRVWGDAVSRIMLGISSVTCALWGLFSLPTKSPLPSESYWSYV